MSCDTWPKPKGGVDGWKSSIDCPGWFTVMFWLSALAVSPPSVQNVTVPAYLHFNIRVGWMVPALTVHQPLNPHTYLQTEKFSTIYAMEIRLVLLLFSCSVSVQSPCLPPSLLGINAFLCSEDDFPHTVWRSVYGSAWCLCAERYRRVLITTIIATLRGRHSEIWFDFPLPRLMQWGKGFCQQKGLRSSCCSSLAF